MQAAKCYALASRELRDRSANRTVCVEVMAPRRSEFFTFHFTGRPKSMTSVAACSRRLAPPGRCWE